jgi:CheY-like chemotaxis protein
MSPETWSQIFDPFFTTKDHGRGTGLGLPTSLGIIRQMGGYLAVSSAPGRGTTFTILLPPSDHPSPPVESRPVESTKATPATVLLLEDEPAVRRVTARILRQHGFEVLAASGGEEALRLAAEHQGPIGLLIADAMLPGLPTLSIAESLMQRRTLKVIFTLGHDLETARQVGGFDAFQTFLPKPFTVRELLAVVQQALEGQPASSI